MNNKLLNKKINEILNDYPFLLETFEENLIDLSNQELTLNEALDNISEFDLEDRALTKEQIIDLILNYVQQMIEILDLKVKSEISDFENQLIRKGLDDALKGNISSHEEVKKRFTEKFAK